MVRSVSQCLRYWVSFKLWLLLFFFEPCSCDREQRPFWGFGSCLILLSKTPYQSHVYRSTYTERICTPTRFSFVLPGSAIPRSVSKLQRPLWPDPAVPHCTDRGRHYVLRDLALLQGQAGDKGWEWLGRVPSGTNGRFKIFTMSSSNTTLSVYPWFPPIFLC